MSTSIAEVVTNVVGTATVAPKNDIWMMVGYCVIVVGVIYFLMVRPNKKRMNEYQNMLGSLKVGDKVLAAGIYGKIKKINEKSIDLEIAKGVIVEISKNAVAGLE